MALKVVDLFCGAGGISQGFEMYNHNGRFDGPNPRSKFEILTGLDIYQPALDTFYANHPNAIRAFAGPTDIQTVTGNQILRAIGEKEIDVVIGGPPCQGFSQAGNRDAKDERNALVPHFARLVGELQPQFFVMENVPGLRKTAHSSEGNYLEWILDRFKGLGYAVSWHQLVATEFGVPQNRKRVVLLGSRGKERLSAPESTHGPANVEMTRKPGISVGQAIMDLPKPAGPEMIAYDRPANSPYSEMMRRDSKGAANHIAPKHSPAMIEKISRQSPGSRLYEGFNHAWIRLSLDRPSPTVKQNNRAPSVHPVEHRVTTPRECARLQSFPDKFIFAGTKSAQLHQVGNAVPPLLARALATVIASAAE